MNGFTLVELLVAIAVLVALMGMVLALYRGAVQLRSRTSELVIMDGEASGVMKLLRRDLSGAFLYNNAGWNTFQIVADTAELYSLSFTAATENEGHSDFARVTYRTAIGADGTAWLHREVVPWDGSVPPTSETAILDNVIQLYFLAPAGSVPPTHVDVRLKIGDDASAKGYRLYGQRIRLPVE